MCYRFRGHFEGDADMYRSKEEKERRRAEDPIVRTRDALVERRLATVEDLDEIEKSIANSIQEMLASVRKDPAPSGKDATRYVFVEQ
jgi:pyruvate dehydrogenase E1 component alpha subunit